MIKLILKDKYIFNNYFEHMQTSLFSSTDYEVSMSSYGLGGVYRQLFHIELLDSYKNIQPLLEKKNDKIFKK